MVRTRPRAYAVTLSDFPLKIEVRANNLPVNRAVIGDLRLFAQGALTGSRKPKLTEDQNQRTIRYQIEKPPGTPPVDITQTVEAFFDAKSPDNARYDISIAAASGDTEKTAIRVPTINPGVANLTFGVR